MCEERALAMYEIPRNTSGDRILSDLEYIDDFRYEGEAVFTKVLQLPPMLKNDMLRGKELINKGYVALWISEGPNDWASGEYLVWGIYIHDDRNYLVSARVSVLRNMKPSLFGVCSKRLWGAIED
jgi:hypothetical protein